MTIKFPLATTSWDQNEYDALQRVITSNMFSMGSEVKEFGGIRPISMVRQIQTGRG